MKPTRTAARGSLAAAAVVAIALTAACGAGTRSGQSTLRVASGPNGEVGKTGPQVLADAGRALATVSAVHVTGTMTDTDSKQVMKLDVWVEAGGGTTTIESSSGSMQMVFVNGRTYFKGIESFLEPLVQSKSKAEALAGQWVYFDPEDTSSDDVPMTVKGLAQGLTALDDGVKVEPGVASETLDGQQVLVIRESDGSRMYVAATGAPLPLKVATAGTGGPGFAGMGNVTFAYDEQPVQLKAPAGAVPMPVPTFDMPTDFPSEFPSGFPSEFPSGFPTDFPSGFPTEFPSGFPTDFPSGEVSFDSAPSGGIVGLPAPAPTP